MFKGIWCFLAEKNTIVFYILSLLDSLLGMDIGPFQLLDYGLIFKVEDILSKILMVRSDR
jgi:hypothetical protein